MHLSELIDPQQTFARRDVVSKAALVQEVARQAAISLGIAAGPLAAALQRREELGSTGLGEGIAIPHARLAEVSRPAGFLYSLKRPIEFDAIDNRPVDLVFVLLLPTSFHAEHLNALALIARRFRESSTSHRLRAADNSSELWSVFIGRPTDAS